MRCYFTMHVDLRSLLIWLRGTSRGEEASGQSCSSAQRWCSATWVPRRKLAHVKNAGGSGRRVVIHGPSLPFSMSNRGHEIGSRFYNDPRLPPCVASATICLVVKSYLVEGSMAVLLQFLKCRLSTKNMSGSSLDLRHTMVHGI